MQPRASELAASFFSCKDRSGQHQNISAMPGCGRAFGSMLRIEAQWDSAPSVVRGDRQLSVRGRKKR